jgi:hypothetical protein
MWFWSAFKYTECKIDIFSQVWSMQSVGRANTSDISRTVYVQTKQRGGHKDSKVWQSQNIKEI